MEIREALVGRVIVGYAVEEENTQLRLDMQDGKAVRLVTEGD
jgi:hypothetical protein